MFFSMRLSLPPLHSVKMSSKIYLAIFALFFVVAVTAASADNDEEIVEEVSMGNLHRK